METAMAESAATDDFDPAISPLTLETLKGRTFTGFHGGIFGSDSYGEKVIIAFGEHNGNYYLGVAQGFESSLRIAGDLTEEDIRKILTPDPNLIDWK